MLIKPQDRIEIRHNVELFCTERGKYVPGTRRESHNVFTTTGRDWIAHIMAWQTIGSPDIPFTQRRLRWIGVGTGDYPETEGVTGLEVPTLATQSDYLVPFQLADFPEPKAVRVIRIFGPNEISIPPTNPVIPVTEAGAFVDVFPASSMGGTEDGDLLPIIDTTLNPAIGTNAPVAYDTFDEINKTVDFNLEVRWTFRI